MEDETMDDVLNQIKFHGTIGELESALEKLESIINKTHRVKMGFYGEIVELDSIYNHDIEVSKALGLPHGELIKLKPGQDYTINLYICHAGSPVKNNIWKGRGDAHVYTHKCNMAVDGAPLYGIIKTFNVFVDALDFSKVEVEEYKEQLKIYAKDKHNPILRERFEFVFLRRTSTIHSDKFSDIDEKFSECMRYVLRTHEIKPHRIKDNLVIENSIY
ncbi:MAG: hypothetical protein Q7J54_05805 [Candidatus Woesearchaeota archaeon]|nr:hypothetical protein [Candidatus Woesearchaeota archaeon]